VVFGWVPTSRVELIPTVAVGRGRSRRGRGLAEAPQVVESMVCHETQPLLAESGKERLVVGSIAKGTPIQVIAWGDPTSSVWVPLPGLRSVRTARLVMSTAALRQCKSSWTKPGELPTR
jgi:hypothetical protein